MLSNNQSQEKLIAIDEKLKEIKESILVLQQEFSNKIHTNSNGDLKSLEENKVEMGESVSSLTQRFSERVKKQTIYVIDGTTSPM